MKYCVICGSYSFRNNADNMVEDLKHFGFPNAEVIIHENHYYAVAEIFNNSGMAEKLANVLNDFDIDNFVMRIKV